jgi:hypothetical protein|tara:strand:- start:2140 stop:3345 length:1206 start_codon:yes stop_codon:yes gene_type:complete
MVSLKDKKTKKVKVKDNISDEVKEKYKKYAKFFQLYDVPVQWKNQPIACKEPNLDPFKKINWKNLYEADQKGRFFHKTFYGEVLWAYICSECKSNRGIKDVAEDVVGTIKSGDLQVTRFAYADGHLEDLVNNFQEKRKVNTDFFNTHKDIWFTDVNMELKQDKDVCSRMSATWLSSKVTAVGSEVRGIWYVGDSTQVGMSKYEDIKIQKMNLSSINKTECAELVNEIKDYKDAVNPWSHDGINGNYGGPEKTWYTVEVVPINPNSKVDYTILEKLPKLAKLVNEITSIDKCTWLVITRVEPKNGVIQRHSDIGHDSWNYQTKNGPKLGRSLRIHFPIQVDDDCIFTQVGLDGIEEDFRLKTGEYYYMDKRKPHWVVNNSDEYRFHVIMDIECEQKHLDALL